MEVRLDKMNWTTRADYIIGSIIKEYDIEAAGISVLRYKQAISEQEYQLLHALPKFDRNVALGNLIIERPELQSIRDEAIIFLRSEFIRTQGIPESDIVSLKSDAIFIKDDMDRLPKVIPVLADFVRFIQKNRYTQFYKLMKKEIYFGYDPIKEESNIDVKGISDENLERHTALLYFFVELFESIQIRPFQVAIGMLYDFYESYVSLSLEVEHYRRFDSYGVYDLIQMSKESTFQASELTNDQKYLINISYNRQLLQELLKIMSSYHFD